MVRYLSCRDRGFHEPCQPVIDDKFPPCQDSGNFKQSSPRPRSSKRPLIDSGASSYIKAPIMASKDAKDNAGEPWDSKTSEKFNSKLPGEYLDPCQEAASRSLKCLHRNGGDREMCTDYFQAYRDCKQQWLSARKEAKLKDGKSWFS